MEGTDFRPLRYQIIEGEHRFVAAAAALLREPAGRSLGNKGHRSADVDAATGGKKA
jgi:hypothetical protein